MLKYWETGICEIERSAGADDLIYKIFTEGQKTLQ